MSFQQISASALVISLLGLGGCQTSNPKASWGRVDTMDRSVLAGSSVQIDSFHHIAKDCSTVGLPRLRVASAPSGGALSSKPTTTFPSYSASSPYARCNNRRVPALGVVYTARPDFRGKDSAKFELFWSDGDVWTYTLNMDVK